MPTAEKDNSYTDVPATIRLPYPEECILICRIKVTATFATWQHTLYLNPLILEFISIKEVNSVLICTLYLSDPDCPF